MPDLSNLTAFDLVGIVILVLSALVGLRRGFTEEVLTLGAWAGAIFITLYGLSWGAQDYGRDIIQPNALADVITAVVLFFAGLALCRWIAGMVGDMMKTSPAAAVDRTLGTAFGFLRGLLVLSAAYLLIGYFTDKDNEPDWIANAQIKPLVVWGADTLRIIVPKLMDRDGTREIMDDMREHMPSGEEVGDAVTDAAVERVRNMDSEEMMETLERMTDEALQSATDEEETDDSEPPPAEDH